VKPFRFCPACGSELDAPDPEGGGRCPRCGRSWYRNPAPTVGAAIVSDGRVLVTVRGREPEKGRLDVPGGFLKPGEEPLCGLAREVKEELGVEIAVAESDFIQAIPHRYGPEGDFVLSLGFKARLVGGEVNPADDVEDVIWAAYPQLDELDFAWPHDRRLLKRALTKEEA
jgi:ADP-ribose pyrophosphatase YjhB (NUDIX family)